MRFRTDYCAASLIEYYSCIVQEHLTSQDILLISDDPSAAKAVREALTNAGAASYDVEWFRRCSEGLAGVASEGMQVENCIAAVLVDLFLPDRRISTNRPSCRPTPTTRAAGDSVQMAEGIRTARVVSAIGAEARVAPPWRQGEATIQDDLATNGTELARFDVAGCTRFTRTRAEHWVDGPKRGVTSGVSHTRMLPRR